jgi:hypothetical protein
MLDHHCRVWKKLRMDLTPGRKSLKKLPNNIKITYFYLRGIGHI